MKKLCQRDPVTGNCTQCGWEIGDNHCRPCKGPEQEPVRTKEPGFFAKARKYKDAIAKWIEAGRPTRTPEEIDRIYAICEACPHFSNDKKPHCGLCGCSLSKMGGLRNKIYFATESCPANPPRWGADSPEQRPQ